jgi:uncharacterized tellurite resistance protein B-like protein
MFKSITDFFEQYLVATPADASSKEHTLELCAAVLMLEIALVDADFAQDEQAIIEAAIKHHFHLDDEEATTLIALAREEVDHATSLHDFTRVINSSLSAEEKTIIIQLLWQVANADGVIDKYQEYSIRKISDLLYVSHKDYIRAKHLSTA